MSSNKADNNNGNTCEHCYYGVRKEVEFDPNTKHILTFCHRNAPHPSYGWPEVNPNDWCGEWAARSFKQRFETEL